MGSVCTPTHWARERSWRPQPKGGVALPSRVGPHASTHLGSRPADPQTEGGVTGVAVVKGIAVDTVPSRKGRNLVKSVEKGHARDMPCASEWLLGG